MDENPFEDTTEALLRDVSSVAPATRTGTGPRVRDDAGWLGRAAKFVGDGAVSSRQGGADGFGPMTSFCRRLVAAGLAAGIALTCSMPEAQAKGGGRAVRTILGIGAGVAGGVLLERMTNGGVSRSLGLGNPVPAQPYPGGYPYGQAPGYGSYGDGYGAYRGTHGDGYGTPGYGHRPVRASVPGREFLLAAKTLVAARLGSVEAADDVVDSAVRDGVNCVSRGNLDCVATTSGVSMDFVRGLHQAKAGNVVVVVERNGLTETLRPDVLRVALDRAVDLKRASMAYDGGMRY